MSLQKVKQQIEANVAYQGDRRQAVATDGELLQDYFRWLLQTRQAAAGADDLSKVLTLFSINQNNVFCEAMRKRNREYFEKIWWDHIEPVSPSRYRDTPKDVYDHLSKSYVIWLDDQVDDVNVELSSLAVQGLLKRDDREALKAEFSDLQTHELSEAKTKGLELQQAKVDESQLKRQVLVFLGSSKGEISTEQGVRLLNEESRKCTEKVEKLKKYMLALPVKKRPKGQVDPEFEMALQSVKTIQRRKAECQRLANELQAAQVTRTKTEETVQVKTEGAKGRFTELNRRFRDLNQEVVDVTDALKTDVGSLEAAIARKKSQLEDLIKLIPEQHERKAMIEEALAKLAGNPKSEAYQEYMSQKALLDQQMETTVRLNDDVTRELAFVDAKYKVVRDTIDIELHSQQDLLAAREAAKEELQWIKRLPKADKALNVYCSAFTFSYDLLSEIGKVVGGDGGGVGGGIGMTAVSGLMGLASVGGGNLGVAFGIGEAVGVGAILYNCKAYDTGSLGLSLKLGLSMGINEEIGARTGIALIYEAGINVQDDRRFRTVSTLKVQWSAEVKMPELFTAGIKADLLTDKTTFVFKDHYQWAAWLSQKWANIRAWLMACTIYQRTGNKLDQPTPTDIEHVKELATITLAHDPKLREIFDRVMLYMEEPILRVESREILGAMSAEVDFAETFGADFEGERKSEPTYYKRQFDPKTKRLWEVQKSGSQWTVGGSAKVVAQVGLQFQRVAEHANPDNEGDYLTFNINLASGTQQTTLMQTKTPELPQNPFGEWIENNIVPLANTINKFAPDILNKFKGPLTSSQMFNMATSLSLAQVEIALNHAKLATGEKSWCLLYWRPIFSSSTSIDKSIPVHMGVNVDFGGSISMSRTYREHLGTHTIGYVRCVYHGLMNRSRPEEEEKNPRPEDARGKVLWDRFAMAHKQDLYTLCRRCTLPDSWPYKELKTLTGHEALQTACAGLPDKFSESGFATAKSALDTFLESSRKTDYKHDLDHGWTPCDEGRFEWSLNPYALITGIMATRTSSAKLGQAVRQISTERRGLTEQIQRDGLPFSTSEKPDTSFWIPDKDAPRCFDCRTSFGLFTRRHHCRRCGGVFCDKCCSHSIPVPSRGYNTPVRVCDKCFNLEQGTGSLRQVAQIGLNKALKVKSPETSEELERQQSLMKSQHAPPHPVTVQKSLLSQGKPSSGTTSQLLDVKKPSTVTTQQTSQTVSSQQSLLSQGKKPTGLSSSQEKSLPPEALRQTLTRTVEQATQYLDVYLTVGDGSCGIHASLGQFKPSVGKYQHDNPADIRRRIAAMISDSPDYVARYEDLIAELLQRIDNKTVTKDSLTPDENYLWTQFKKVRNLQAQLTETRRQSNEQYQRLGVARNAIIGRYRLLIAGSDAGYDLLRGGLADQVLASNNPSDKTAKTRLQALQSEPERMQLVGELLRAGTLSSERAGVLLAGSLEDMNNLAATIDSPQTNSLVHDYSDYKQQVQAQAGSLRPLVQRMSADLRKAYAAALQNNGYYLLTEDLQVLADLQHRSLTIFRRDDRDAQRFINLAPYKAEAGSPILVYHQGAHWEHAVLR